MRSMLARFSVVYEKIGQARKRGRKLRPGFDDTFPGWTIITPHFIGSKGVGVRGGRPYQKRVQMKVSKEIQRCRVDQEYRRLCAKKSLMFFILWYLPHKLKRPTDNKLLQPAPPHYRISKNILKNHLMCMLSRGMGKTTFKIMNYIWRMTTDPDDGGPKEILDWTSPQLVKRSVKEVSTELLYNKALIADFGKLIGPKSKLSLEKEPELQTKNGWKLFSRSIESGIRGYHPAEIDIDDVLDREACQKQEQRDKVAAIYAFDVKGMLFPGFRMRFWGTPMHPQDLISSLFANPGFNPKLRFPAEYIDRTGNRVCMWPDMWTLNDLDEIRKSVNAIYPGAYQQEYLLRPYLSANQVWTPDMIQFWDRKPPHTDMLIFTGIDLAYGVKDENSKTCITSWGMLMKATEYANAGQIFELRTDLGHYSPDQVVNITLNHCKDYNYKNTLMVEDKVWANAMEGMLRDGCDRLGVPPSSVMFEAVKIGRGEDKKTRANNVVQFWKDGIVYQDVNSPISDQMLNFTGRPKEENDGVDAAVHAVGGFKGRQIFGTELVSGKSFSNEPAYDINESVK